ncbi:MAG TPA: alginate lyase family protein [Myxococcaceae bacterium]
MPPAGLEYYAAIARSLTPADLAHLAARRAYRLARRRLYRRDGCEPFEAVLVSHGVRSAVDLPAVALDRPGRVHCDLSQRPRVLAALAGLPGAPERALARANAAAERRFHFLGADFPPSDDGTLDASIDPVSGHHYPLLDSEGLSLLSGGADPKLPWALGRLDQLVALAQGVWVAADEADRDRFAAAFVAQATEFLHGNPVGLGIQWTCPMEVALRAANLAQGLRMLADVPAVRDPGFVALALGALAEHARFVEAHLEDHHAVPNNHLVSNLAGLLVVSALFPGLPDAPRHTAHSVRGLEAQMQAQVHPDGCSFEGSVPYHRLAVELFTLAYVVARASGISLSTAFTDRLALMYRVVEGYCTERGRAPQLGDNDSGRAFPLADRESLDHGYLLPLGAALFCDGRLKRPGATFCDEGAWLLGSSGLGRFEALGTRPSPRRFISRLAGWAVVKQDGAYLAVSAGRAGQSGVGGHSHNDALSFELHLRGRPLIVDPGTCCYAGDHATRNAFRSTAAHNTLQVDGEEINPFDPARLFALPDRAAASLDVLEMGAARARLTASHRGYRALPEGGVEIERTFLLDKGTRALSVVDTLQGRGVHRLVSRLHLEDRRGRLRPVTPAERVRALRVPNGPVELSEVLFEIGDAGAPEALVLFEPSARPELSDAGYSPGYGEKRPALVLQLHRALRVPGRMGWVVLLMG